MFVWPLFLVLVIGALMWSVRPAGRAGGDPPPADGRPRALDMLEERYARGEIDRDEYLQRRSDLVG